MVSSLNPRRYRVEHIHDLSEAALRAEIVLAHALVIHSTDPDEALGRQCASAAERLGIVLVSSSPHANDVALSLGGRWVQEPFDVPELKRAVYRAVSKTEDRRHRARLAPRSSHLQSLQRVLIITEAHVKGAVMSAVLRNQLSVTCDVATNTHDALRYLADDEVHCVAAEIETLMSGPDGAELARALSTRGIPVIPIKPSEELDVADAGQAAWDIVPQVRRSLTAKDRGDREAG